MKKRENRFMAVDQYGTTYHGIENPRADLLSRLYRKHAEKMYLETKNGGTRHCGYIIGGLWLTAYKVTPFNL